MSKILSVSKYLFLVFTIIVGSFQAAYSMQLLPHRAVYDLKLKEASSRSGISGLVGRIVYEFRGSKCDGYTVNFRFVSEIFTGESARVTDQQSSTYENPEDGTFRFINRAYVNEKLDREVRGVAEHSGDSLKVDIKKPEPATLDLPKAHFPTAHLIEMIDTAKSGEIIYESRIFDGSDGGDEAMITTGFIGKQQSVNDGDEVDIIGETGRAPHWPISLSYFQENEEGDALPVYRISFKLYEDGVSRDLLLDYGDFAIEGKISGFEVLEEAGDCE